MERAVLALLEAQDLAAVERIIGDPELATPALFDEINRRPGATGRGLRVTRSTFSQVAVTVMRRHSDNRTNDAGFTPQSFLPAPTRLWVVPHLDPARFG